MGVTDSVIGWREEKEREKGEEGDQGLACRLETPDWGPIRGRTKNHNHNHFWLSDRKLFSVMSGSIFKIFHNSILYNKLF